MLIAYEAGIVIQGAEATRNGADAWLRGFLERMGFGQYFLLPILTCGLLLAWHHAARERWNVSKDVLMRMVGESVALAVVLICGAQTQSFLFAQFTGPTLGATVPANSAREIGGMIGYLGAGIYEELLFRLMIVPAIIGLFRAAGGTDRLNLVMAATLSSLLFAAAHYQLDLWFGPWHLVTNHGYPFDWFSFLFRFWAGMFFAYLFVRRGFGIAAGAHALYDILAVLA